MKFGKKMIQKSQKKNKKKYNVRTQKPQKFSIKKKFFFFSKKNGQNNIQKDAKFADFFCCHTILTFKKNNFCHFFCFFCLYFVCYFTFCLFFYFFIFFFLFFFFLWFYRGIVTTSVVSFLCLSLSLLSLFVLLFLESLFATSNSNCF